MPEPRPTDEERARWQDAIATDLNGLDWWERRDDLIDAIFAAGAEAVLDGMTVQHAAAEPSDLQRPYFMGDEHFARDLAESSGRTYVTRRVTDWQPAESPAEKGDSPDDHR